MATRVDVDRMLDLVHDGAPLIDVLPSAVYAKEHLPGAVSIPLKTFTSDAVAHLDRQWPIVVYCFDQH